jgi:serine/threonine protein phosphatase PrpC
VTEGLLDLAAVTDVGTERAGNEDACGALLEAEDRGVIVVADGVSLSNAGEVASQMAVEVLLRAYREDPAGAAPGTRLYRAVQQANIEIYDRQVAVPELRGMTTTLTAAVVSGGELTAVHVGDTRLYLIRQGTVTQLTKDHTAAAEKVRLKLMSRERALQSPDRSVLTRSVGRELICARDRLSQRLLHGDSLLICSDGLHGVLSDEAMGRLVEGRPAMEACRALLDAANELGTPDNLSAAVLRVVGPLPEAPASPGLGDRLRRLLGA